MEFLPTGQTPLLPVTSVLHLGELDSEPLRDGSLPFYSPGSLLAAPYQIAGAEGVAAFVEGALGLIPTGTGGFPVSPGSLTTPMSPSLLPPRGPHHEVKGN